MQSIQRITPNLWFDGQAEEAARFYASVFKGSEILNISYYGSAGPGPEGSVLTVDFTLEGQRFTAINGGPEFTFNEAVSFLVDCDTQEEIDYFWDRLSEGGDPKAQVCGWLKDKYGLSWQIVPRVLAGYLMDADSERSQRAMRAMFQMKKLDIAELKRAYDGTEAVNTSAAGPDGGS